QNNNVININPKIPGTNNPILGEAQKKLQQVNGDVNFPGFIASCKSLNPNFDFTVFLTNLAAQMTANKLCAQQLVTALQASGVNVSNQQQIDAILKSFGGNLPTDASLNLMGNIVLQ